MTLLQVCFLTASLMFHKVNAPLLPYTPAMEMEGQDNVEELIKNYFNQGYTYTEIVSFLLCCHGITLSLSHLKRLLKKLQFKRKLYTESPVELICEAVVKELETSGRCLGYKTLWRRLQKTYGLKVRRETVLQILRLADPEGIAARRQQRFIRRKYVVPGPNFLWHIDGYDKLKPFGFAVHGCIDGYSRRILWLDVASSNNNPRVIAYYYLKTIQLLKKVPRIVRSDKGTENGTVALLQQFFRSNDTDSFGGVNSYMDGKSTSNQKIECWWSQMKRNGANWWISYFKDMRDRGLFNDANPLHVECLRFCFAKLLQSELQLISEEWNQHSIRKQKQTELPSGKPDVMFFLPELTHAQDYGCEVSIDDVNTALEIRAQHPEFYSPLTGELVELLKPGTCQPTTIQEAFDLYTILLTELQEE